MCQDCVDDPVVYVIIVGTSIMRICLCELYIEGSLSGVHSCCVGGCWGLTLAMNIITILMSRELYN